MNPLSDVTRFYYHRTEQVYRLERTGQPVEVVNPPSALDTPEFILYTTLEAERISGQTWRAVGLDMAHGYGWIFERNPPLNEGDTEPVNIVIGHRTARPYGTSAGRKELLTKVWQPILLILAATAIDVDDVVEMISSKGKPYFGTVLEVEPCRVRVEYLHPSTHELWRVWRDIAEVTVIHKAKAA